MSPPFQRSLSTASMLVVFAAMAGCSTPASNVPTDAGADHHDASLSSDAADARSPTDAKDARSPHDASDAGSPSDAADAADAADSSDAADAADAGSSDAGDAASPFCGDGGYLFCDGFEKGITGWTQKFVSGGTVTADSTYVHSGTYALHAHVDPVTDAGATAYAYVQQIQTWPTHVFARFFAYQPSPLPPSPVGLIDLVQEFTPFAGIEVLIVPPDGGLAMKTYSTGQDQAWMSEAGATTPAMWTCFELEVDVIAETSHLYLNGTEVTDLAQTTLGLPTLGIAGVGLSFYLPSVQGAQDGWIDDVAINGARIGCTD